MSDTMSISDGGSGTGPGDPGASARLAQAKVVFLSVRTMQLAEREAAIDRACAGDAALRSLVLQLLAGEAMPLPVETLAEDIRAAHDAMQSAPMSEPPGSMIDRYRLLSRIGEGGFGVVFAAEQTQPVQRRVALKIIKLGMDTRAVIARFEAERQALAMLDHPNIAKVLDAGATQTGRPYFVMELVKGEPIVQYCDRNNLSITARLELFSQVCAALQHAHTKGIIHRDIKPSNVLVSTQDGKAHAKVIDFGVAKATASKLTEKTLFTEHRQIIGTPEYMSPEQAEGSLDIDTRTDVYSLGVLLYELLTGTTPFSSDQLRSAAYGEIQRIIREVDPPKPSTRLSTNTATIDSVATKRQTEPRRLGSMVRGELDWIVMKAMDKNRQRRYESASGLEMDILRYLTGGAVVAAPPSRAYQVKKFVRRNRVMVAAGSAVAASLLIGALAFAWQAKVARDQRDIAVQAQASEAKQREQADAARAEALAQEAEAKKQAAIAEAVASFQTDMLASVDPDQLPRDPETDEPLRDRVTVVQAIETAVRRLDEGSLKDQPLVESRVRSTIGVTLRELARYNDAEPNLRKSLALARASLPAGHHDIGTSLNNLATLLQDQNKLDEAETLFREALAIDRANHPSGNRILATSLNNLAMLLQDQNNLDEAESLYREALDVWRAVHPEGHPGRASVLNNLGFLLYSQSKFAQAEPLFREVLEIDRAALPKGHPTLAIGLGNLAVVLQKQNKLAEAEPLLREALDIYRASLPPRHPEIAIGLNNLANLLREENKLAEAEQLVREALEIWREALPAGHPDLAKGLNNLAMLLRAQSKLDQAEPLFREALKLRRESLPAGDPKIADSVHHLALLLQDQKKLAEAEPLAREAVQLRRAEPASAHEDLASSLSTLAGVQHGLGKTAEARVAWDEAIAILRIATPEGSALVASVLWQSGTARLEQNDARAALPELEEAVTLGEKFLKPGDSQLQEYRDTLAKCKALLAK
jgi:serine/threonine protein kinase/tetratricopeptide (TPR) repeat protein